MEISIVIKDPTPDMLVMLSPFVNMDVEKKETPVKQLAGPAKVETPKKAPAKVAPATDVEEDDLFGEGVTDDDPAPTLDRLKEVMREKVKAEKQPAVKALIEKYGAATITGVPKEKYGAFYKELKAI